MQNTGSKDISVRGNMFLLGWVALFSIPGPYFKAHLYMSQAVTHYFNTLVRVRPYDSLLKRPRLQPLTWTETWTHFS